MTTRPTPWQRIQSYIWLVCGVGCLLAALIFWAITDTDALVEIEKSAETEVDLQIQPEKVAATHLLGALEDEVRPLEMTTRMVNTGSYEAEFRGSKFINDNKNAFTLELFRVSKVDIIRSFLKKQDQRKNFFYIRLNDADQVEQYALIYGIYKNNAAAQQALQQLDLKLPKSIQPKIQAMKDYTALVNDMGAEEMRTNQPLYAVNLKVAALPRLDESLLTAAKPAISSPPTAINPKTATTNTTVTRRDPQGNIVDVQQSRSNVDSAPKSAPAKSPTKLAETEISDPFN